MEKWLPAVIGDDEGKEEKLDRVSANRLTADSQYLKAFPSAIPFASPGVSNNYLTRLIVSRISCPLFGNPSTRFPSYTQRNNHAIKLSLF